jgi:hypothetical protein
VCDAQQVQPAKTANTGGGNSLSQDVTEMQVDQEDTSRYPEAARIKKDLQDGANGQQGVNRPRQPKRQSSSSGEGRF